MSLVKSGISAVGRLLIVVALLGTFLLGLFGVVIFSLQGQEVKVPEIVGKDFSQSEKELAALGLKIKKRAARYSQEMPNTILEQSPRPGETVKTGIPVFVTISRAYTEGDETPVVVEKETNEQQTIDNDNEPINTALTKKDKPKKDNKANTNANLANKGNLSANTAGTGDNKNSGTGSGGNQNSDNSTDKNNNRTTPPANTAKPPPAKTPAATTQPGARKNP